jgi:hypothetical protein
VGGTFSPFGKKYFEKKKILSQILSFSKKKKIRQKKMLLKNCKTIATITYNI